MPHKKTKQNCYEDLKQMEMIEAISQVLNVREEKILDNIELFSNMNIYIRNIFYYLAQIKDEQKLIDASYALELLLNFHRKRINDK